jgi:hypothetical protein
MNPLNNDNSLGYHVNSKLPDPYKLDWESISHIVNNIIINSIDYPLTNDDLFSPNGLEEPVPESKEAIDELLVALFSAINLLCHHYQLEKTKNGHLTEEISILADKLASPPLNSGNSGVSPSSILNLISPPTKLSDIDEPPLPPPGFDGLDWPEIRKQGAQDGHEAHFRKPLTEEDDVKVVPYGEEFLGTPCPTCGTAMVRDPEKDRKFERNRLPDLVVVRELHVGMAYVCPICKKVHTFEVPKQIQADIIDENLCSLMGIMKGEYMMSLRNIQEFLTEIMGLGLSLGKVNNTLKYVSAVLRPIFREIYDHIKNEPVLNIDETSFRLNKKRIYTWIFRGKKLVLFKNGTRSRFNLDEVLGDGYQGIIGCDCYSAYFSFAKKSASVILQLCWAHLLRDYIYCYDYGTPAAYDYGLKCLRLLKEIFTVYRDYRAISDPDSQEAKEKYTLLLGLKAQIIAATIDAPSGCKKAMGLAERFRKYAEYYFIFFDHPEVGPTNNPAEIGVRYIVIDRKICYGVQSMIGSMFCETMWTVIANLRDHGIRPQAFISEAIKKYEAGEPLPSLVNLGETVAPKYVEEANKEIEQLLEPGKDKAAEKKAAKKSGSQSSSKEGKGSVKDSEISPKPSGGEKTTEEKAAPCSGQGEQPEEKPQKSAGGEKPTAGGSDPSSDEGKQPEEKPAKPAGHEKATAGGSDPSSDDVQQPEDKPAKPAGHEKPTAGGSDSSSAGEEPPEEKSKKPPGGERPIAGGSDSSPAEEEPPEENSKKPPGHGKPTAGGSDTSSARDEPLAANPNNTPQPGMKEPKAPKAEGTAKDLSKPAYKTSDSSQKSPSQTTVSEGAEEKQQKSASQTCKPTAPQQPRRRKISFPKTFRQKLLSLLSDRERQAPEQVSKVLEPARLGPTTAMTASGNILPS